MIFKNGKNPDIFRLSSYYFIQKPKMALIPEAFGYIIKYNIH